MIIYDNGGKTLDRYTVFFQGIKKDRDGLYDCLTCSENGLGVYMWSRGQKGCHLGKVVKLDDIEEGLRRRLNREANEILLNLLFADN